MVLSGELRIGRHVVRNVRSGVSGMDEIILAFPVVNGIASITVDTPRHGLEASSPSLAPISPE